MEPNNQMRTYKNSWWNRLGQKIKNMFKAKKEIVNDNEIKEVQNNISKEEFMKIYEEVKKDNIDLRGLDKETLKRVMLMLNEEIEIKQHKLEETLKDIETSIYNLKVYQKELEIKKNS